MQTHREGMSDNRDSLSREATQLRVEPSHFGFLQQLRREHPFVANVQILLAPIPNLPSGDLPLSSAPQVTRAGNARSAGPTACTSQGRDAQCAIAAAA